MNMEEKLTPIKLKTWVSRTISGCFEERVGVNQVHLGTSAPLRDIVCWQGKITVVQWGLLPVLGKCEPWVITSDVMSPSGYLRRRLLKKEIFRLWDCLEDIWMQINEAKLGLMWRELFSSPKGRTLQVILEELIKYNSDNRLGQEDNKSLIEQIIKLRGDDMWKPAT